MSLMVDFDRARQVMVDGQLRAGGVSEPRLISRMAALPRERFVPEPRRALAYVDDLHWLGQPGSGRFMPAPATLGKLLKLAAIGPADRVLDIGAGTGYATAVVAGLAAAVTGLEQDATIAAQAVVNLAALQLANTHIIAGTIEQIGAARFNVIFVQGMLDTVPQPVFDAIEDGGRLVALIRKGPIGIATIFTRSGGAITARHEFNAFLPPLFASRRDEEFIF